MKISRTNRLAPPARGAAGSSFRRARLLALAVVVAALAAMFSAPGGRLAARLGLAASAADETVQTFASDCVTPRTVFYLGDTVCALVSNAQVDSAAVYRRLQWGAPDVTEGQRTDIYKESQYELFHIPSSGPLAQIGSWTVQTIDPSANGYATAKFVVRDPFRLVVDLSIFKYGPAWIVVGEDFIEYTISITNNGPETAREIQFSDGVPKGALFYKMGQTEGREASCVLPRDPSMSTTCTIAGMREGEKASFRFIYKVDPDLRVGTVLESTAQVFNSVEELDKRDNYSTAETTIVERESDNPPPIDN